MRFTYQQAYQHLAVKKRFGEKDLWEKFLVIDILRREFKLYGLTGEIFMIDDSSCRLPDVFIKNGSIVIELDGGWHGHGDDISKKQKDVNRDSDYISNGAKLIIINEDATHGYQTDEVIKVLEYNGLKRIAQAV